MFLSMFMAREKENLAHSHKGIETPSAQKTYLWRNFEHFSRENALIQLLLETLKVIKRTNY
jgi:hypothetical protein